MERTPSEPVVREVQQEFALLRDRFPFLQQEDMRNHAGWSLHGISDLNLDLRVTFNFPQINDAMIAGNGKASLNEYLTSHQTDLSALTPRWTVTLGRDCRVHAYDGEISAQGVIAAIERLMSTQSSDEMVDQQPLFRRPTWTPCAFGREGDL